jgi:hypothetical protein
VITEVPGPTVVAKPPAAIVATVIVPLDHVTVDVMSFVELSEYVPVAVNCCEPGFATVGVAGVTAIETKFGVTVNTAIFEVTPESVAVMFEVPTATPVARPVAEIVAVAGVAEFQVTVEVMSFIELSE